MTRKIYPQPGTTATKGSYFVSVMDDKRNLFDLRGPVGDDLPTLQKVNAANRTHGNQWHVCTVTEGPVYAESVRDQLQTQFPNHTFVESAMATDPVAVVINRQPLEWVVP